jgi:hypothetical protein
LRIAKEEEEERAEPTEENGKGTRVGLSWRLDPYATEKKCTTSRSI